MRGARWYGCVGGVGRRWPAAGGCTSIDYTVVGVALIRRGAVPVPHLGTPVARLWTIVAQTE